jgi:hypothetical protein
MLDRLPHRVEHHELRIVYAANGARRPLSKPSFGKDLQLIVVYGAVILAFLEGRKPTIASIVRYLQLPRETTRRYKLIWTDEFHGGDHTYVEGHQ